MKILSRLLLCSVLLILTNNVKADAQLAKFNVPNDSSIPEGPQGVAIRQGKKILNETRVLLPNNVGNALNCTSCHLSSGTAPKAAPFVGLWGIFPEFNQRDGHVVTLSQRINDCFERSMNGQPISYTSEEMINMLAYMNWLSTGVPTGQEVSGRGFGKIDLNLTPDSVRGKVLYAQKCSSCHGADGGGLKLPTGSYIFPPLWGDHSFNDGAGMARTSTAAAFIRYKMPEGMDGSLTDQEALDIAEFFAHQPRPKYKLSSIATPGKNHVKE
jgi:thiosulfate dehydrogenase